eukprot:8270739-Pyramimonas_sp.AAC.1
MPQGEIDLSTPPDAPPGAAAEPSSQDIAAAFGDADNGDQLGVGGGMGDAADWAGGRFGGGQRAANAAP